MPIFNAIGAIFTWLWEVIIKPIVDWIGDALGTMGGVFEDVFGLIGDSITGAFEGAVGLVKGVINGMIDLINGAIGGINMLIEGANNVPGVNIGTIGRIPHLAQGALVSATRGGSAAILGEGRYDEAVIPLGGPQLERIREVIAPDEGKVRSDEDEPTRWDPADMEELGRIIEVAVRGQSRQEAF